MQGSNAMGLRERLNAQYEDDHQAHEELKQAQADKLTAAQEALAAAPGVPPEKRVI